MAFPIRAVIESKHKERFGQIPDGVRTLIDELYQSGKFDFTDITILEDAMAALGVEAGKNIDYYNAVSILGILENTPYKDFLSEDFLKLLAASASFNHFKSIHEEILPILVKRIKNDLDEVTKLIRSTIERKQHTKIFLEQTHLTLQTYFQYADSLTKAVAALEKGTRGGYSEAQAEIIGANARREKNDPLEEIAEDSIINTWMIPADRLVGVLKLKFTTGGRGKVTYGEIVEVLEQMDFVNGDLYYEYDPILNQRIIFITSKGLRKFNSLNSPKYQISIAVEKFFEVAVSEDRPDNPHLANMNLDYDIYELETSILEQIKLETGINNISLAEIIKIIKAQKRLRYDYLEYYNGQKSVFLISEQLRDIFRHIGPILRDLGPIEDREFLFTALEYIFVDDSITKQEFEEYGSDAEDDEKVDEESRKTLESEFQHHVLDLLDIDKIKLDRLVVELLKDGGSISAIRSEYNFTIRSVSTTSNPGEYFKDIESIDPDQDFGELDSSTFEIFYKIINVFSNYIKLLDVEELRTLRDDVTLKLDFPPAIKIILKYLIDLMIIMLESDAESYPIFEYYMNNVLEILRDIAPPSDQLEIERDAAHVVGLLKSSFTEDNLLEIQLMVKTYGTSSSKFDMLKLIIAKKLQENLNTIGLYSKDLVERNGDILTETNFIEISGEILLYLAREYKRLPSSEIFDIFTTPAKKLINAWSRENSDYTIIKGSALKVHIQKRNKYRLHMCMAEKGKAKKLVFALTRQTHDLDDT